MKVTLDLSKIWLCLGLCTLEQLKVAFVRDFTQLVLSQLAKAYIITEGTLLPQARNSTVEKIYHHQPDFTHILFIDCDQCGFNSDHVKVMLAHDKDIIAGVTPRRRSKDGDHVFTFYPVDTEAKFADGLIEVVSTGMFFTLVRREVFDAMVAPWFVNGQKVRDNYDLFGFIDDCVERIKQSPEQTKRICKQLASYVDEKYFGQEIIGEDVTFCHRARELGFKIWVDTRIQINHVSERILIPRELGMADAEK